MTTAPDIAAVILAGGLARRMGGGDKGLQAIGGIPILARVIAVLAPQVAALVLNANGDAGRFAGFGLPVVADGIGGFPGPLAGVLAGLDWARIHRPDCPWVLTVPSDTPFLPPDLAARLRAAVAQGAELACARSAGQVHPVVGLWPVGLADQLRRAMVEDDVRRVNRWTAGYQLAVVDFAATPRDPFFNANTPADMAEAERLLAGG